MTYTKSYTWILALVTVFFCISSFGNGANDVANSYANSVAARTLTLPQVGVLAVFTEFIGAVALGAKVTNTIKNGIMNSSRFVNAPATLMLAMACAEAGSAAWLIIATKYGFPVSTTQTIVGAIVGAGIASGASVNWGWRKNSISQVAASWIISPIVAGIIASLLFGSLKFCILERRNPFQKARRAIHFYLAFTAGVLALFMVVEAPNLESIETMARGKVYGAIFGCFFGMLAISYIFFDPFFERRLVKKDPRVRFYHIPLGPLLRKNNCWLYFPARKDRQVVIDYYQGSSTGNVEEGLKLGHQRDQRTESNVTTDTSQTPTTTVESTATVSQIILTTPEERYLEPTKDLPIYNPDRLWSWMKYIFLQGVTRDCISHSDDNVKNALDKAIHYDIEVEYLWTFAQVASCMIMSIAHGSNDVANAVGPWVTVYSVWKTSDVQLKADAPTFILAVAGLLLGAGFWFYGWRIIRAMGSHITQLSPVRGFSVELGTAITVLMASQVGIPVSTTQCLTGALIGVGLMNGDAGAVNWRQVAKICLGWLLTMPCAGMIAGLLCVMGLNTPHF